MAQASCLGASGGVSGASWSVAERRLVVLVTFWIVLGFLMVPWATLGAFWRVSWWVLEPLGSNLERFGGIPAVENH